MKNLLFIIMILGITAAAALPGFAADSTIINESRIVVTDNGLTEEHNADYHFSDNSGVLELKVGESFLKVGNTIIGFNSPVYIQSESASAMLPLRAVSSAVGGTMGTPTDVKWDGTSKTATVSCNGNVIVFKPESHIITVNGKETTMKSYAEIKNEQLFVPMRPLCEALSIKIEWEESTKTIKIHK